MSGARAVNADGISAGARGRRRRFDSTATVKDPASVGSEASPADHIAGWIALLLVVAVVVWIRLRYLDVPFERDEGEFAYGGQLLLQGIPPFRLAYNMKFPGIHAAYAVLMAVFGESIAGVRLGLLCVNAGSTVLVFLLGRKMLTPLGAAAAAAVFAILSAGTSFLGPFAHATHFVVLPALAGLLALSRGLHTARLGWFLLAGCLFGVAILMKQPGVVFAVAGFVWWAAHRRSSGGLRGASWKEPVAMLAGVALPLGITVLWLWWAGVFGRFRFWVVDYLREYGSQRSVWHGVLNLWYRMQHHLHEAPIAWLLAGFGAFGLASDRGARGRAARLIGFAVISFIGVCPGFYFRRHYFLILAPALGLLAGAGLEILARRLGSTRRAAMTIGFATLTIAVVQPIVAQRDVLFAGSPAAMARAVYGPAPFPESIDIARYIRAHSGPEDRIAVLGSEPQIYFYANRRSATGYIYVYALMEVHAFARAMQVEMVREIEAARPKFIVVVTEDSSWTVHRRSDLWIFDWIRSFTDAAYHPVGVADILPDGVTEYRWDAEAARYPPRSDTNVVLLERRG
jgi:hypothetical protein